MSCSADRLFFKPETLKFFRIITSESLINWKLLMPKEVVREHRYAFTNPLLLKVANCNFWQVEFVVSEDRNSFWLQNGFKRFAQYYGLDHEYVLLFEYQRKECYFHVRILSDNGCEINYPLRVLNGNDDLMDESELSDLDFDGDDDDDVECLEILKENPNESPRATKSPNFRSHTPTRSKTSNQASGSKSRLAKVERPLMNTGNSQVLTDKASKEERRTRTCETNVKPSVGVKSGTARPFFTLKIYPTNIHPKYMLGVPAQFARDYLLSASGSAVLCGQDGGEWRSKYFKKLYNGKMRARIFGGWRQFVIANSLVEGDECLFELVKHSKTEITLQVVVYRKVP